MFKLGDIVISEFGVMHAIVYIDDEKIYFLEDNVIYGVDNNPEHWTLVDTEELMGLKEVEDEKSN